MSKAKLPEPAYFSLAMLSKRWECSISDIIHYGMASDLPICVVSDGWHLEEGYYDDGFPIPTGQRYSFDELLPLHGRVIKEISKFGQYSNPFFSAEGDNYLHLDYRYDQDEPDISTLKAVQITSSDLMIRKEDVYKFEENGFQPTVVKESPSTSVGRKTKYEWHNHIYPEIACYIHENGNTENALKMAEDIYSICSAKYGEDNTPDIETIRKIAVAPICRRFKNENN